jgi:hypothetical protein
MKLVPKGDVEDMAAVERNSRGGQKRVTADWSAYLSLFEGTDRADCRLTGFILPHTTIFEI